MALFIMKSKYGFLFGFCAAIALGLTACATKVNPAVTPHGQLVQDAEQYVSQLRQENKLPGFSSAEHGRVIAAAPWDEGEVSYPAKVIVRAWKSVDNSAYSYTLVKDSADAPWRMTAAARLSSTGKQVEDLTPK